MEDNKLYLERINGIFFILGILNILIIAYMSGTISITLYQIISMKQAVEFLDIILALPYTPPISIVVYSVTLVICICLIIRYRLFNKVDGDLNIVLFLLEIGLALLLMYILGFSTNAILLLLVADLLNSIRDAAKRNAFLIFLTLLYLISNSAVIPINETLTFTTYISVYNSNFQFIIISIYTILHILNIILFIAYMYVLIQTEVNEGRRVNQLNFRLNALNVQLKEFANMSEKMGETRERNRLAREIHDTLGYTLTGLSVGIDAAIMISDVDVEATKKQLSILSETARQGLTDVRRSVNKLRPDALENHELKTALEKMIIEFELVSNTYINFVCHMEELRFNKEEEEVVYRVIQEGLTNSIRHGKAENVFISLAIENNKLIIILEDDGIGCKNIKDGFGLHHMRERIGMLDGLLRVYGHNGFIIIAEIPLRKDVAYD